MSYTKNLEAQLAAAREQLANVNVRQADIRREVRALNVENRRLREKQPERVQFEKTIAKLRSSLAQAEHKLAHLHEPDHTPHGLALCKVCRAPVRDREPIPEPEPVGAEAATSTPATKEA